MILAGSADFVFRAGRSLGAGSREGHLLPPPPPTPDWPRTEPPRRSGSLLYRREGDELAHETELRARVANTHEKVDDKQ